MKIINPLQMNDWPFRSCLKAIAVVQLLLWIAVGLDVLNVHLPIIRQITASISLLFIPGMLVLRSLRLHKLGSVETVVYSVGLSIAAVMITGLLLNSTLPLFSIAKPLSAPYLIDSNTILIVLLTIISYIFDKHHASPSFLTIDDLSPTSLTLMLFPFLAVFSAYLVNTFEISALAVLLVIGVTLLILVGGLRGFRKRALYPLAIYASAAALILQNTLISQYIWGWDIFQEYGLAATVIRNGVWDPSLIERYSSMLSVTILGPYISLVCNLDLTWVFKVVYPLIFALVPVVVYQIVQKQTNDQIGFFSSMVVITSYTFFITLPAIARQEIAELFLVLLVLVMLEKHINRIARFGLGLAFAFSLIVGHLSTAYVFIFALVGALLLLPLIRSGTLGKLKFQLGTIRLKRLRSPRSQRQSVAVSRNDTLLTVGFVLLIAVMMFTWAIYTGGALEFSILVKTLYSTATSATSEFFSTSGAQGLSLLFQSQATPMREIAKYLYILGTLIIVLGLFKIVWDRRGTHFEDEYFALAIISGLVLFVSVAFPVLSYAWNSDRFFQLMLLFLAPFFAIGCLTVYQLFARVSLLHAPSFKSPCVFAAVFLSVFFLFNSGLVFALAGELGSSPALSHQSFLGYFEHPQDVATAMWLDAANKNGNISGEYFENYSLVAFSSSEHVNTLFSWSLPNAGDLLYMRYEHAILYYGESNSTAASPRLLGGTVVTHDPYKNANLIYDSGALVFQSRGST